SAARSALFNAVLAARVTDGSWERLQAGDVAVLEGRGSIFAVASPDAELAGRCARLEIHPTGPLWGGGAPPIGSQVLALEEQVALGLAGQAALCTGAGMRQERRALRLVVQELVCEAEHAAVWLRFRLGRGCFATALLRELFAETPDSAVD